MADERKYRFTNNSLPKLKGDSQNPVFHYDDVPVQTVEKAVENLIQFVPDVLNYVLTAKQNCNRNSNLTPDESAAIRLYTMSTPFVTCLNQSLRSDNPRVRKPWFPFLKLIIEALKRLPPTKDTVWRGVDHDVTLSFVEGEVYTWWTITSCSRNSESVRPYLGQSGTLFTIETTNGRDVSEFSAIPAEQEVILMPSTRVRVKSISQHIFERLSIIHLEEVNSQSLSTSESNYLFERIKEKYKQKSRIERFMNPSKSFPIQESYINLAIVKAKEQHAKENQLRDSQHSADVLGTFEQIYGTKAPIDPKNIFETCKSHEKQVLVFGRAGIGKSTFCQYIAYQWTMNLYWPQYELLALIQLRRLTDHRYPPLPDGQDYSLLHLLKKEIFRSNLSEKEEELLKKQLNERKILWILDGYDEIIQNVPLHLQHLFEQLLETPDHIITSRPYLNTLSYDVQMEITGFTDENITEYVERFFDQMKDELNDAMIKSQKLLKFLKSNKRIWGVAHIPVNLELICSLWSNEDWSGTEQLTITTLYTKMTEWLCLRYLRVRIHNNQILQLSQNEIGQLCQKELAFLEQLAFHAMESNTIIIRSSLLKKALHEAKMSLQKHPHILNMGIVKSVNGQGTGSRREIDKDHYFVHLSFQEYFAARYFINTLKGHQNKRAIEFIKYQKYNQRYILVFTFAAGLLSESGETSRLNLFWDHILGEPLDLVGLRQIQLIIFCLEETNNESTFPRRTELLQWIAKCIHNSFIMENEIIRQYLLEALQRAQSTACDQVIVNVLITSLQHTDIKTKKAAFSFISNLQISNPPDSLIKPVMSGLEDRDQDIREKACSALGTMGEKAATKEAITKLVSTLEDQSEYVRWMACEAFGQMGEKAATNKVITKLVSVLADPHDDVRGNACEALGKMGAKVATNEVITKLVSTLGDQSDFVRRNACEALVKLGESAATNEVITKLVSALEHKNEHVRGKAYEALGKMGEKAAKDEVLTKLVSALGGHSQYIRGKACEVLGKIGEKAATNEVITKLVNALGDHSEYVRGNACSALVKMGESAATNEVIIKLVSALEDQNDHVRGNTCDVFGKMGEKAATNEVITKLVSALQDQSDLVRWNACEAVVKMGEKAVTNEMITKLVNALGDQCQCVRGKACEALGNMGEKAATNEVINKLVHALRDPRDDVSWNACSALLKMGERVATNEVIIRLVSALEDQSEYVRGNACEALGKMDGRAATNEVITKLVNALGDQSDLVRWNACEALVKMGEKATTNEVITKLVSALGGHSQYIRGNACSALGKIGEKAVTNEVITKLVSALEDQSQYVRGNACEALGKMGEKVATNEMVTKLVSALEDHSEYVREKACEALGKMGEKALTNEVITKLVSVLEDQIEYVRGNACEVLGKMGTKAATNEIITKLAVVMNDIGVYGNWNAADAVGRILSSMGVIKQLDPKIVTDLSFCTYSSTCFKNVSEADLINAFVTSEDCDWLPAMTQVALLNGVAVRATEKGVVLYDKKEPVELHFPNSELRQRVITAFIDQQKRLQLQLCPDITLETVRKGS